MMSGPVPHIRPMVARDREALLGLLATVPEFSPTDIEVAVEVIDSYLRDPGGSGYNTFVAEVGGVIAGYICYGPTPLTQGTWDIYWMATAPDRQGQGIGTGLMEFAEGRIAEAGGRMTVIETSSRPEYEKTRRFHGSKGYRIAGRIPDFYAPGDDGLFFIKKLGDGPPRPPHSSGRNVG